MIDLNATAIRNGNSIEVLITGMLNDSCHKASIVDIYPGGNRAYFIDPGVAQVFIKETSSHANEFCLMYLVPWAQSISIPDKMHHEVEIYINNKEVLQVKVKDKNVQYVVCELRGFSPVPSCNIVPEGMCLNDHPFRLVFGPASYEDCLRYKTERCPSILNI
jgi:hypothetical protein